MFCEKCGKKLRTDNLKCPECGHDNQGAEYCGGFWGITREENETRQEGGTPEIRQEVQTSRQEPKEPQRHYRSRQERKPAHRKLLPALCLALVLISLVQMVHINILSRDLKKQKKETEIWRDKAESSTETDAETDTGAESETQTREKEDRTDEKRPEDETRETPPSGDDIMDFSTEVI